MGHQKTTRSELRTTRLRGFTVLANERGYPLKYGNRTQAERKADEVGGEVLPPISPAAGFCVSLGKAPLRAPKSERELLEEILEWLDSQGCISDVHFDNAALVRRIREVITRPNLQELPPPNEIRLSSISVLRVEKTIFIPLPRALWRDCGSCQCEHCEGGEGFWDTLAVSSVAGRSPDVTWTVHAPEHHPMRKKPQR